MRGSLWRGVLGLAILAATGACGGSHEGGPHSGGETGGDDGSGGGAGGDPAGGRGATGSGGNGMAGGDGSGGDGSGGGGSGGDGSGGDGVGGDGAGTGAGPGAGTGPGGDGAGGDGAGPGGGGGAGAGGDGTGGTGRPAECGDGIDNDGDGLVDWQRDLGCANQDDDDESAAPRADEDGFTTFDASAGSQIVYVSSSAGDDANDGSSPSAAVATLGRAAELVRDGEHDFMLLRRGDTWRGESLGRFKSGQDAEHPLVVAGYGDELELPRVEIDRNFIDHNGQARDYVALVGIHFVVYPKIPGDPAYDGETSGGLRYVGGGRGLLIESCHFEHAELVVQTYGDFHYDGVEVRRNVIEDNYHIDTCGQNSAHRPSGIYSSHVAGLTIEGNVFDHNGWSEEVASACATMYNHNMYLNADGLVVRDNIIARASSMGIKMRSDATGDADDLVFENNFFVDGEIGLGIGGNTEEPHRFSNVTIRDNVFSQIGIGNPTERNFSWMLQVSDNLSGTVEGNYFLHQPWYTNAYGIDLGGGTATDITIRGNTFYDLRQRALRVNAVSGFSNVLVSGNRFVDPTHGSCLVDHSGGFGAVVYESNEYQSASGEDWFCVDGARQSLAEWATTAGETGATEWTGSFTDPDRTVGEYADRLALGSDLEAFLAAAVAQTRFTWRPELTAPAVNDYIRAGFQ